MMWMKNRHQQNVNRRSMIGDKNIILIRIRAFPVFQNQPVVKSCSVKKNDTKQSDKNISVFKMFFFYREQQHRNSEKKDHDERKQQKPSPPKDRKSSRLNSSHVK